MRPKHCLPTILAITLLTWTAAAEPNTEDWPQCRGPGQDGGSRGDAVGEPFGLAVAWKRPLGSGYSSISIAGDRGMTMFTEGDHDFVAAFDAASGEELWRHRIAEKYAGHDGSDDGPLSTPTIHDGTVFVLGGTGELLALALADGAERWSYQLDGETNSRTPHYGFTTAPVVAGELLIVQTGGADGHSLTAFDRAGGEVRWTAEDDSVAYQSPVIMQLAGREQLVVVSDHLVYGVAPASGEVLWRERHTEEGKARGGSGQPLRLSDSRILVRTGGRETAVYEVTATGGGHAVSEVWRNADIFKRTHAVPVFHDGYVYGFDGRFLACIDPATGEEVWKSRPPGGLGLILVDGHLVMVGAKGDLMVAEASSEGYRETARLALFERQSWTPPSFAGGHLFVRDLSEMASVKITDTPLRAVAEAPAVAGLMADFASRLEATEDKAAHVEELLAGHPTLPIVEDSGWVHFLYRGEAKDVAVAGNFTADYGDEQALSRLAGTDLFARSVELDPAGHYEYRFNLDFGTLIADPANPLGLGEGSELRMPGWEVPDHLAEPAEDAPRGELDSFHFRSELLENDRRVRLYLPPGYGEGEARYPLVLVHGGDDALDEAQMDRSLDNLIAGGDVAPMIVAFLPRRGREYNNPATETYVQMLADELVPHLDRHYRTVGEPASRAILGTAGGAQVSVYAAFKAPGVFGKVATQSFYLRQPLQDEIFGLIESAEAQGLEVYVEVSSNDIRHSPSGLDAEAESRRLIEALEAEQVTVHVREVVGAPGWGHWRAQTDDILALFFPAQPPAG